MVKEPVVTVFATELPETVPIIALDMTAAFAGPPTSPLVTEFARSIKNFPAPDLSRNAPNIMNRMTKVAETAIGAPKTPSLVR